MFVSFMRKTQLIINIFSSGFFKIFDAESVGITNVKNQKRARHFEAVCHSISVLLPHLTPPGTHQAALPGRGACGSARRTCLRSVKRSSVDGLGVFPCALF